MSGEDRGVSAVCPECITHVRVPEVTQEAMTRQAIERVGFGVTLRAGARHFQGACFRCGAVLTVTVVSVVALEEIRQALGRLTDA